VVAGNGDYRRPERAQPGRRPLVLVALPAVCQVTRRQDHGRGEAADEVREAALDGGVLTLADVQVGDVENPDGHRRPSL
jgi:hypothetical protein